jgi:hypothetical protein
MAETGLFTVPRSHDDREVLAIRWPPCVCFCGMRNLAKWVAVLFIAVVAVSPIFEVLDKSDGLTQDTSDLARYALCLFGFLAFALRRTVITLRLISFHVSLIHPFNLQALDRHFVSQLHPGIPDRPLFLTLHDLRI